MRAGASVPVLLLLLVACATPGQRVAFQLLSSGAYRDGTTGPEIVSDHATVPCTLGTTFGVLFRLEPPSGVRLRYRLVTDWTHPPILYPQAENALSNKHGSTRLDLPLKQERGVLVAWVISQPSEQIAGEYRLQLAGPGPRVLFRRTFTVAGCPSPA